MDAYKAGREFEVDILEEFHEFSLLQFFLRLPSSRFS